MPPRVPLPITRRVCSVHTSGCNNRRRATRRGRCIPRRSRLLRFELLPGINCVYLRRPSAIISGPGAQCNNIILMRLLDNTKRSSSGEFICYMYHRLHRVKMYTFDRR